MGLNNGVSIRVKLGSISSSSQLPVGAGRGRGRGRRIDNVESKLSDVVQIQQIDEDKFKDDNKENEGEGRKECYQSSGNENVKDDVSNCPSHEEKEDSGGTRATSTEEKEKKSKFWIENKALSLPPVPHVSDKVLEEADIQFYAEEVFGHNVSSREPERKLLKPLLPKRIIERGGRYCIEDYGQVKLPLNVLLDTWLLYIDCNDALYLRYQTSLEDESDVRKLSCYMKQFYSVFRNQVKYCIGQEDSTNGGGPWFPDIGEVVVVKLKRLVSTELSECGYFRRVEMLRAVVTGITTDHLDVELLDEYGKGGVSFDRVFRILPRFTTPPPQMFICELADIGLINFRTIVRPVLETCPITKIWPDPRLNYVGTTWHGECSEFGRPRVEIKIQLKVSPPQSISLKTHVYRNLQSYFKPFTHLIEALPRCYVIDVDSLGFLWVRFVEDDELRARLRFTLDNLIPYYKKILEYLRLTVDMILPEDNINRSNRNKEKMYAVMLSDVEEGREKGWETLYRVVIREADRETDKVTVYCVDYHKTRKVYSWELVPLCNLYPDIAYIAPLLLRVHLYGIKELDSENEEVKDILLGRELKMKLIHEWPRHAFPPDVSIMPDDGKDFSNPENLADTQAHLSGFARYFVTRGLATMINTGEMEALCTLIHEYVAKLEKDEREQQFFDFDDKERKKLEQKLVKHTFVKSYYVFTGGSKAAKSYVHSNSSESVKQFSDCVDEDDSDDN